MAANTDRRVREYDALAALSGQAVQAPQEGKMVGVIPDPSPETIASLAACVTKEGAVRNGIGWARRVSALPADMVPVKREELEALRKLEDRVRNLRSSYPSIREQQILDKLDSLRSQGKGGAR